MSQKVKRIDKELPMPKFADNGSVGLDTYVREDRYVGANCWCLIPLNLIIKSPDNCFIGVLPRSSTFKNKGLILANSIGVVDKSYCGPTDEICALVYNTQNTSVEIHRGERLFQLLFINCETPEIEETDEDFKDESRNGFGSTGNGVLK
jgi:dUTP pyrophosphatase